MSPLFIRIMLHFYSSPTPYVHGGYTSMYPNAVVAAIGDALNARLIKPSMPIVVLHEAVFELTPRGQAYVDRLLETPLPRKAETWVFDEPEGDQ